MIRIVSISSARPVKTALYALLLAFSIILCFSCNKSKHDRWVFYDETYCSDKWPQSSNNETLKQNLVDYFKEKKVKIYDIEIFVDRDSENSSQCYNKTGRRFRVLVSKSNLDKMIGYGFYE